MSIKEFIQSPIFRGVIIGVVLAIVVLVIFQAGVIVGERRSDFAHRFGDSFEENFRGPEGVMAFRGVPGHGPLPSAHGAVGKIISVALPNVLVAGPDNLEKTVVIRSETVIREFQTERLASDLNVGDHIVAFGEPNEEGQIEAKLVRLLPPPDFKAEPIQP